jgi:hypothetical protein
MSRRQQFGGRTPFGSVIISIAVPVATRTVIVRAKNEGSWPEDDLLNTLMKRSFGYGLHQQLIHARIARRLDEMTVRVARNHDDWHRLHLLIRQAPESVNKGEPIHRLHYQIRENKLRLEFGDRRQCRVSVSVLGTFDPNSLQQPVQKHTHVLIVINDNSVQAALRKVQMGVHNQPAASSVLSLDR